MSEVKRLSLLIFLLSSIPVLAYILGYNFPFIEELTADYQARLLLENFPLLREKYVYHVRSEGYSMLYRAWNIPLYFNETPSEIGAVIKEIAVIAPSEAGLIPYVKDYKGEVYVFSHVSSENIRELIAEKAERNEVGVFNPQGIRPGDYTISYAFKLYLPIETAKGEFYHFNLKLADEHVPYTSVDIIIEDLNGYLIDIYPHLSSFITYKGEKLWVVEGKAPRDSLVEIEMVLLPNSIKGVVTNVQEDDNVKELTAKLNLRYYAAYNIFKVTRYLTTGFSLSFPLIIYIIYQKYGKERKYIVPEFLSFIPNKNRKPWVVNLIFKGKVSDFDASGFYATLLDLHMRGYIRMEPYDEEVRISILREDKSLDEYERKVLTFLRNFSFDDVFDSSKLKNYVTSIRDNEEVIKSVKERFDEVLKYRNPKLVREFIELIGKKVINGLAFTSIVFSSIILMMYFLAQDSLSSFNAYMSFVMSTAIIVQSLVCLASPPSLFGRWKGEGYNEKLMWDAFRKFLTDVVLIKKYAPKDLVIWKEWLVYANALGVGENVIKAMRALNVEIPEVKVSERLPVIYTVYYSQILPATSSEESSTSSTGGFGAGGGHGGGGAGGR